MQRAGLDALEGVLDQALQMAVCIRALEIAELLLFRDQPLSALEVAVDEHVESELQVREDTRMQVADLLQSSAGKAKVLLDLLLGDLDQVLVDDVAHVLEVDREGHDI